MTAVSVSLPIPAGVFFPVFLIGKTKLIHLRLSNMWQFGLMQSRGYRLLHSRISYLEVVRGGGGFVGWLVDTVGHRGGSIWQGLGCWATKGLFWAPDLHLQRML